MDKIELQKRTKDFALRIIKMAESLPTTKTGAVIAKQIIRSSTSVGANYRAVCRAKSKPDFIAKMGIVIEEAEETAYWLELIEDTNLLTKSQLINLQSEINELLAIFVSSQKTAKSKINNHKLEIK